jgi:hypothetical protein
VCDLGWLPRVPQQKLEHQAVQIGCAAAWKRMAAAWQNFQLGAGNPFGDKPRHVRRDQDIVVRSDHK